MDLVREAYYLPVVILRILLKHHNNPLFAVFCCRRIAPGLRAGYTLKIAHQSHSPLDSTAWGIRAYLPAQGLPHEAASFKAFFLNDPIHLTHLFDANLWFSTSVIALYVLSIVMPPINRALRDHRLPLAVRYSKVAEDLLEVRNLVRLQIVNRAFNSRFFWCIMMRTIKRICHNEFNQLIAIKIGGGGGGWLSIKLNRDFLGMRGNLSPVWAVTKKLKTIVNF